MPMAAVFADTQAEPFEVYNWLSFLEAKLPFPVYRVTQGSLWETLTKHRHRGDGSGTYVRQSIPAWVDNGRGSSTPLMRGCTRDYKVHPILRKVRELRKEHGSDRVTQWIGISRDEAHRMKDSGVDYIDHRWPLIEKRMTRTHCLEWMRDHGYPLPPRSACVFCPYHSDIEWNRLKSLDPDSFAEAVRAEKELQAAVMASTRPNAKELPYLHKSLKPLETINFSIDDGQIPLFGNECEGMCGV